MSLLKTKKLYDCIIIGAGSSGCVLANRLSNSKLKVLLVEAGGDDKNDPYTKIPVGYYKTQMNPTYDWCYNTRKIPQLQNRELQYPRGKIMGGSSSVNGMLWVRGQANDFDEWSKILDDRNWSSTECIKRFEKIEKELDVGPNRCNMEHSDLGIQTFIKGVKKMINDNNNDDVFFLKGALKGAEPNSSHLQQGVGMLPVSISSKGLRSSSSSAFLRNNSTNNNLDIMMNVLVDKLIFENELTSSETITNGSNPVCTGIRYKNKNTGKVEIATIKTNGEVILTSGAINSPYILLRSGIGCKKELDKFNGINLIKDLPCVGKYMQDHCQVKAAFKTKVPTLNDRVNSYAGMLSMGLQFLFQRRGPMTMSPTPACAFVNNKNNNVIPNLQLLYGPWTSRSRTVKKYQLFRLLDTFSAAALTAVQLRPTSRGSITLGENKKIQIQPNFLHTEYDQKQAIENVRYMLSLCSSTPMKDIIDVDNPVESEASSMSVTKSNDTYRNDESFTSLLNSFRNDNSVIDDERILNYVRNNGTTIYHPVGTCRMGANETDSVVNSKLRVHGIDNLSVADASIMPNICSGNTNATSIMIGETASEIISKRVHFNQKRSYSFSSTQRHRTSDSSVKRNNIPIALGFDFGTESCRACLVDTTTGNVLGSAVSPYKSGQITNKLINDTPLEQHVVLQNSQDWVVSAEIACKQVLSESDGVKREQIIGIGSCFTSCTPLPCLKNGQPLHTIEKFRSNPNAWPKLWKHQASKEAKELTKGANNEKWLKTQYGGSLSAEWLHPKALEIYDKDREVFDAMDLYIDAGDWFVNYLVQNNNFYGNNNNNNDTIEDLKRSACQAGFKGCWIGEGDTNFKGENGFPPAEIWNNVRDGFGDSLSEKYESFGTVKSPGSVAGLLSPSSAEKIGLLPGIPVSVSTIDAHCGVPGVGVGTASTLVMVMGTSCCYMLNMENNNNQFINGCLGRVENGILPGLIGLEMGQSAMGDIFAWLSKLTNRSIKDIANDALQQYNGYDSNLIRRTQPIALDWFNGCRSPHNNGSLKGGIMQLDLSVTPSDLYLAIADGLACGARDNVLNFRNGGAPIDMIVAGGGLPHVAPLLMQRFADALQHPIYITETEQSNAVGAAIFGACAGNIGFGNVKEAVETMSMPALKKGRVIEPNLGSDVEMYWNDLQEKYSKFGDLELGIGKSMY